MRRPVLLSVLITCACACAKGSPGEGLTSGGGDDSVGAQASGSAGGAGGAAGAGGGAGAATSVGSGGTGACSAQSPVTSAMHVTIDVSWTGNTHFDPGNGQVDVWAKVTQMYTGNTFTGTTRMCGLLLPDTTATPTAGGKLIGLTISDTAWDSTNMPSNPISGMHTGIDTGSTIAVDQNASLLGLTLLNPITDLWPSSYASVTQVDHDSDGNPGFTALAKVGATYQQPAVNSIMSVRADKLYLAARLIMTLAGTRNSCGSVTGTATVQELQTHIMGCHILGGNDCAATHTQYADDTRVLFTAGIATYASTNVPDTATCADVRAAVP